MKKEMLINVLQPEECRIAIVEDGVLEELYVERTSHESYTGNIYKGKIVNLEPAIQAAFVDFSVGRNGFLHVSDVEPQYYQRHLADEVEPSSRDARKDRDDRRRSRAEDSDPTLHRLDERGRERDRERDRERPDLSERGRRDRSEFRRFGEGLGDEDWLSPPPREPARPEPVREEPRHLREPELPSFGAEEPPPTTRSSSREARPPVVEEPRSRYSRPPEPFDPDLPPSRTQRSRQTPPPPRIPEPEIEELGRARIVEPPVEPEPAPEVKEPREPKRSRGRGRGRSAPVEPIESLLEPTPEIKPTLSEEGPEAPLDEIVEAPPRRRGGRAAIRSRGGDREPIVERPREVLPERPREVLPERPREVAAERPREVLPERSREIPPERPREILSERTRDFAPEKTKPVVDRGAETELERYRSVEPERIRERSREVERGRIVESDPFRERSKAHDRAGEPGYVPRRERVRPTDSSFGAEITPPPFDWADLSSEGDVDDTGSDLDTTESPSSKLEGPRRRRRRRGRRRERERSESIAPSPLEEDTHEFDEEGDELDTRLEREISKRSVIRHEPTTTIDEFDFGDETVLDHDEDEIIEEEESDEFHERRTVATVEEEIDPELEEEIRREIAEIAELEREMGLRGPVEARPRRGGEPEAGRTGGRFTRGRGTAKPPIQEVFRRGDEVLVQVIKESIGTKGPTLSTYISIPGRYLVLMPGLNRVGVSRKIADEAQRRKLREIMNELNPPKGLGFIVRTAGLERTKRELARDLAYLLRLWKVILRRIKKARTPAPIYQESDMITRTIRDIFTSEIDTIWIDEPSAFERAQEFLRVVMPRFVNRLKLYDEKVPLFHKYGIEDEIAKIQRRHVPLPEGGSIVIDQTEALVAIDVNSGNFRVENDAERTAYEMNLRAAKEIARQLRLRDLGGVIVNDFIDMRDERHRRGVERALRDAIKRDRARTKVLRMSAFGLIEMTRQRIRPSLKRSVYEDCPNCTGAGVVKTVESMSIDVMRLLALASHREDIRRVNIAVGSPVATYLNNRKRREIARIEVEANMTIHIRSEDGVSAEHLQIDCFDGNNGEIRLMPQAAPTGRRVH